MADIQRQAIEHLLGRENTSVGTRETLSISLPRVCKLFIVGTCPHDLFVGTKQNLGKCHKLHLEKYRLEYQSRVDRGDEFPEFEYEYFIHLRQFIEDLDNQIAVARKRLEHTPEEKVKIAEATRELDVADMRIALMTQELHDLLDKGDNQRALLHTIALNKEQTQRQKLFENVRSVIDNVGQSSQQKLQVCEGCGAYLSRLDSDQRLAHHLMGKIHIGYVQMRKAYNRLALQYGHTKPSGLG